MLVEVDGMKREMGWVSKAFFWSISINKTLDVFKAPWLMVKHGTIDVMQTSKQTFFHFQCLLGLLLTYSPSQLPYLSIKLKKSGNEQKEKQPKRLHVEWSVKWNSTKAPSSMQPTRIRIQPLTPWYVEMETWRKKESSMMMT